MPASCRNVAAPSHPPVRVFTLGRFYVELDRAPLRFGRKAPRRPLELLKVLVAHGSHGASDEQIAEDLWPDAEGDAGLAALRTTLSRLRRLIGTRAVLVNARRLSLCPEHCWVDALAADRLLAQSTRATQDGDLDEARTLLDQALAHYRGALLPGEFSLPPVIAARSKLQTRYVRCLQEAGGRYEMAGRADAAIDLYRKALEIDDTAEDVVRGLMQCCRRAGRGTEGIAAYWKCEASLRTRFGASPSAATQAAFKDLLTPVYSTSAPGELTIAVLEFRDRSPGRLHQGLADAVRETVIDLLDAYPQISLVTNDAAAPTQRLAGEASLRHWGRPVRYLLRGSVLVSGRRLRAGVELIDAKTGLHAWSEQHDQDLEDALGAQDRIAIQIAEGLTARLVRGESFGLLLSPSVHVWKALAQIRVLMDRQTRRDHFRARALMTKLLDQDGHDPLVLGLRVAADVIASWKCWLPNPEASLRSSESRLRRLQRRYGESTHASYVLPYACALRAEFREALRLARRHVDRMPQNFFSHAFVGTALLYQRRDAEALEKLDDAIHARPEPLHWLVKDRAVALFRLRRYDEAIGCLARVLKDDYPVHRHADLRSARLMYVGSLAAAGRLSEARHEARAELLADPGVSAREWSRWHFQWHRDEATALRMEQLLVSSGVPL